MAKPRTRVLAIDPGKVRIGLAVSDPDRRIASPLTTYTRKDADHDAAFFRRLVEEEEIGHVLVGLPVHLSGQEGEQARLARSFGEQFEKWTGLAPQYWD